MITKRIKASHGQGLQTYEAASVDSVLGLSKTSSSEHAEWLSHANNLDPRLADWIRNQPLDHDKYTYTLVVPLGADESWEETVNGDAFLREDLAPENRQWGHKTFEVNGRAYSHHKNNDPSIAYGDLPFMVFNQESDRCEGIWRLDNALAERFGAKHVIDKIRRGLDVPISMGCKVPYDVCSLCGNKAKNITEYCEHTKNPGFGSILADMRKMRVFNPHPSFFDLSDVGVNAAPEAVVLGWLFPALEQYLRGLSKSSGITVLPSVFLHEAAFGPSGYLSKTSSGKAANFKLSDLIKEIPAMTSGVLEPLQRSEAPLEDEDLNKIGAACCEVPQAALTNMLGQGIIASPLEFAKLISSDEDWRGYAWPSELAADVRRGFEHPQTLDLIDLTTLSASGLDACERHCSSRSLMTPFLQERVAGCISDPSRAQIRIEVTLPRNRRSAALASLYGTYIRQVIENAAACVARVLTLFPTSLAAQRKLGYKQSSLALEASEPLLQAILASGYLLKTAGCLTPSWLQSTIRKLNQPVSACFYGSVLIPGETK